MPATCWTSPARSAPPALLVEIAGQYDLSGAPRDAYLEAARSIRSTFERQRAQAALVEREGR